MPCSTRPRLGARLLIMLLGLVAISGARASAGDSPFKNFFAHDVRVITVTDFSDEGRKLPLVSTASPVYYMLYDFGFTAYGRTWAGEKKPAPHAIRQMIMTALAGQGYRVADPSHPPTQTLALTWGLMGGSTGMALQFLGGDKLDLMWELENNSWINPSVLRRGMRSPLASKVMDLSGGNLFVAVVRSYDPASLDQAKMKIFWETRFASPADGMSLAKSLPMMVKAAAASLGVETTKPVDVNATKEFQGTVELGELKTIEMIEPEPAKKAPPSSSEER